MDHLRNGHVCLCSKLQKAESGKFQFLSHMIFDLTTTDRILNHFKRSM